MLSLNQNGENEENILDNIETNSDCLSNGYISNNLIFLTSEYTQENKIIDINPPLQTTYYIFKNLIHTTHETNFQAIYLLERRMNIFSLRMITDNMQFFMMDFHTIINFIQDFITSEANESNISSNIRFSIQFEVYINDNYTSINHNSFGNLIPDVFENNVHQTTFGMVIDHSTKYIFYLDF